MTSDSEKESHCPSRQRTSGISQFTFGATFEVGKKIMATGTNTTGLQYQPGTPESYWEVDFPEFYEALAAIREAPAARPRRHREPQHSWDPGPDGIGPESRRS